MATTSSWSQLLKTDFTDKNPWPDISESKKLPNKIPKTNQSTVLEAVANPVEMLDNNYNPHTDTRTREQIQEERAKRKTLKAAEKKAQNYEQKLQELRSSKSEKIKIIDRSIMDKMNKSTAEMTNSSELSGHRKKNHQREVNLADFIVDCRQNQKDKTESIRSAINAKPVQTENLKRHKGKKREIPKKKWVSSLKKSILSSRELRCNVEENETAVIDLAAIVIDDVSDDCAGQEHLELDTVTKDDKNMVSIESNLPFSRKFRSYCTNFITLELCQLTDALLRDLFRFQDRAYQRNQIKGRAARRFVVGFKETQRQLAIRKIKLLIMAPDLERSEEPAGIYDTINGLKRQCDELSVPYLFCLGRWKLGHILLKKVPVACVGIMNYEGSEEITKQLLPLIQSERNRFAMEIGVKSDCFDKLLIGFSINNFLK